MAVLALALFGLYAVIGFGLRSVLQRRRTGDAGFRGVSGRPGSVEWWAGIAFVGAVLIGLLGPVTGLAGLGEIAILDRPWVHALGVVLACAGIAATFLTQLAMGESWRVGVDPAERTALVTDGPFRFVRNPIFTAMLLTGAGIALVFPNLVAILGWVLLLAAIELQVRVVEEPYLGRQHGEDYRRYTASTGRFLPGLGRLS